MKIVKTRSLFAAFVLLAVTGACTACSSSSASTTSPSPVSLGDLRPAPSPTTFAWNRGVGGPVVPNRSTPCPGKWSGFLSITGKITATAVVVCPSAVDAASRRYVYVAPSQIPALFAAVEKAATSKAVTSQACASVSTQSTATVSVAVVDDRGEIWNALDTCMGDDPALQAAVTEAARGGTTATR